MQQPQKNLKVKPRTPDAAEKANTPKENPKFTLPVSGLICEKTPFKGKNIREAQRLVDGDQSKAQFALMSVACLIDGKRVTMEEIDDMDGEDVMEMLAQFEPLFR